MEWYIWSILVNVLFRIQFELTLLPEIPKKRHGCVKRVGTKPTWFGLNRAPPRTRHRVDYIPQYIILYII